MLGLQKKITTLLVGMVGIGVIGTVAGTVPNRATGRESVSANCCKYIVLYLREQTKLLVVVPGMQTQVTEFGANIRQRQNLLVCKHSANVISEGHRTCSYLDQRFK